MRILVTGFEPFGGETINPSYEAVRLLDDTINGAEIIKLEVPVTFTDSINVLNEAIVKFKPDAVLCIGQAGGRAAITIEKVAINLQDASIPDNDGNIPMDKPVHEDGDTAYFAKLPVKRIAQNIKSIGVPASVSYTAGTYVCNNIMYEILYLIDKKYPDMKGGFIHVPFIPEQVCDKPSYASMSLENITRAIEEAIRTIASNEQEIDLACGATH